MGQQVAAKAQMPSPRLQAAVGPCYSCGELGHLKRFCPKLIAAPPRWYPCDDETREWRERDVKGSANSVNDVIPSIDKRSHSWDDCVSKDTGSVNEIDVREGSLCCSRVCGLKGSNCACSRMGQCEWRADYMASPSEMGSVSMQEQVEMAEKFWEYERERDVVSVKGRLAKNIAYWRDVVQACPFILDTVQLGYVIPFEREPTEFYRPNRPSALANAEFVNQAIHELREDGRVEEVKVQPHVCSPLSVVENARGKKRLVLDLRHVNKYVCKQKFKYEDLRVAMMLLDKGDYMFTYDLKSGYHHVDIRPTQNKYLGFAWERDGTVQFYVFTVLPFGLATACYIFTKLLRPLVKLWRRSGVKIVMYLDDGIGAAAGRENARRASCLVRDSLVNAGFVFHIEKSCWEPASIAKWLGFLLDLEEGCVSVLPEKIAALKEKIATVASAKVVQARQLASITGTLLSMSRGIGPMCRLMTRAMYALIESRVSWCDRLKITSEARYELEFWLSGLERFRSQPIWRTAAAVRVVHVYSDASDTGYGGYTVEHRPYVAQGQWSPEQAKQSSTWRELKAVGMVLESLGHKLSNSRVRWLTDNQNVVRILEVGSRKCDLQREVLRVFKLMCQYQIHIEPSWIPREENQYADYLSRIIDYDDWRLNPIVFSMLDGMFGPHTIDRFADANNTQLIRFNSRYWSPGSEAVDAFTVNWARENNWLCPPIGLIPRVIRHMQACRAQGTLIVPMWESAPFWPILCPHGSCFAGFIGEWCRLPQVEGLFLPSMSGVALFDSKVPNTPVLAIRIQCEEGVHPCGYKGALDDVLEAVESKVTVKAVVPKADTAL